jgi:archaeosine synthase alpha-subunit
VTREVLGFQGLALPGFADLGPFRIPIPWVLDVPGADPTLPESLGPRLATSAASHADGEWRGLQLTDGRNELALRFPVLAPEVTGTGEARPLAEGIWSLLYPAPESDWSAMAAARPQGLVLANARHLLAEGEPLITALEEVRRRLGARPVLWLPRVGLPHRLALLAYLGIDVLDATEAVLRAADGTVLDPTLGVVSPPDARVPWSCGCEGCRVGGLPGRTLHARIALQKEAQFVRETARIGRLRELVESRQTAEPVLAELLRYADGRLGPFLEQRTPVVGAGTTTYVLRESRRRPEVLRFRARVIERYRPPPSKRVLLLVPCSKTKPYRQSRSHRAFARAWQELPGADRLHVVSVTSPLGLVPRELEDVYPARHYDIPVTGVWEEDEREAVVGALRHLLAHGAYERVVAHLDPEEYGFLRPSLTSPIRSEWTLSDGRTTRPDAIAHLEAALRQALGEASRISGGRLSMVREELEALASYQFGPEAARRLFAPPLRLMGRPWFQRLVDPHGTDLATWREERGIFHLTVAGAARFPTASEFDVEVVPELALSGDLFVPGVAAASGAIRVGDAVRLTRAGVVLGVGEARLPGPLMTELDRGLAVTVRHRAHATPP